MSNIVDIADTISELREYLETEVINTVKPDDPSFIPVYTDYFPDQKELLKYCAMVQLSDNDCWGLAGNIKAVNISIYINLIISIMFNPKLINEGKPSSEKLFMPIDAQSRCLKVWKHLVSQTPYPLVSNMTPTSVKGQRTKEGMRFYYMVFKIDI